jgi:hypothetical protein
VGRAKLSLGAHATQNLQAEELARASAKTTIAHGRDSNLDMVLSLAVALPSVADPRDPCRMPGG